MAATARVPLLWPASWTHADALALLNSSPINHLIPNPTLPAAVEHAARGRGLSCEPVAWRDWGEIDWPSGGLISIGDGFWPGSASGQNRQEGGPTGAPWVDANGWIIQLARGRMPEGAELLLNSAPPEDTASLTVESYLLALSESWAYGAVRPVWLAPQHATEALGGSGAGATVWRSIVELLRWQQARQDWARFQPVTRLLVISDFSGPNQYMSGEVLNLAARQHIAFTPVETRRLSAVAFGGKRAALYVDTQPPPAPAMGHLRAFVSAGGLLLTPANTAALFAAAGVLDSTHPRFTVRAFGKGRIAVSKQDYDDPWILARDAHLLMSRRWDSIRLFNAGSMLAHHAAAPGGASSVVHLLNYTCRPSANVVSLQVPANTRSALLHTLDMDKAPIASVRRDNRTEIDVPPFPSYCAIELSHA
ncbi:MAG TPA: hypothetical protein PKJ41_15115 [Bryobacteraceae bacterium]|nr:hypothetical protein [Bryobacteraceae bacterium]HPT28496.1 hypothetical protein [Bryobacteraceae bacterium]